jgi:prophage maintenance system killer protein
MATKQKRVQPKPKPPARKAAAKPAKKAVKKPAKAAKPQSAKPKKAAAAPKKPAKKQAAPHRKAPKTVKPAKPATVKAKPAPPSQASPASQIPPLQRPSNGQSKSIPQPFAASPIEGGAGVRYLTVQDLVELHRAVSLEFGGNQASPGVVESQFGLVNTIQRPQVTTLGREAYPTFPDKVAAFVFALLQNSPFKGGNRRVALASLFAFFELNNRTIDIRVLDEKTAENLLKRAAGHREMGIPPENVFREVREIMSRAIVAHS